MAFQGAKGNLWSSLMSIPEARKIKLCMNENSKCEATEILKQETETEMKDRLLVNPEFMANLDQSDGSQQFDDEEEWSKVFFLFYLLLLHSNYCT